MELLGVPHVDQEHKREEEEDVGQNGIVLCRVVHKGGYDTACGINGNRACITTIRKAHLHLHLQLADLVLLELDVHAELLALRLQLCDAPAQRVCAFPSAENNHERRGQMVPFAS